MIAGFPPCINEFNVIEQGYALVKNSVTENITKDALNITISIITETVASNLWNAYFNTIK